MLFNMLCKNIRHWNIDFLKLRLRISLSVSIFITIKDNIFSCDLRCREEISTTYIVVTNFKNKNDDLSLFYLLIFYSKILYFVFGKFSKFSMSMAVRGREKGGRRIWGWRAKKQNITGTG